MLATVSPFFYFWITRDFPGKLAGLPRRKQLLLIHEFELVAGERITNYRLPLVA
jgi:hypothetical protein